MAIMSKGPCQPEKFELPGQKFPTKYGHRFSTDHYWKKLQNNDRIRREWLSYSLKSNRIFCHYCMFFGGKIAQKGWIEDGFQGWNRLGDISNHEKTSCHINASITFKMKKNYVVILPMLEEKKREEVAVNRDIVNTLVEITMFLGKHSLPFRGHRENWTETNKGNFKDLAELISKWSSSLALHINKVQIKGRSEINFLSWERQNQLIDSVAICIKEKIHSQMTKSKFFSVSIDTTFDVSKKEQLAFIIRYINFEKIIPEINERLIALKESSLTTGSNLFCIFKEICDENKLDWKTFLIGQSYDGASNMRGEYQGLQAHVISENPATSYIWCYAHRLSLIVVNGSSSSQNSVDMFGNLEVLYAFISSNKKRVAWFEKFQKECYSNQRVRRLKRVETTRWLSHSSALKTVLVTFDAVIQTLEKIQQDERHADFKSSAKSGGLIDYFLSERFILTAFLYDKIFDIFDPLTKMLQSTDIDLLCAIVSLQSVTDKISKVRTDDAFIKLCSQSKLYMENSKMVFSPLPIHRPRKKKQLPGEYLKDSPIMDPMYEFKINTYFSSLDTIISSINERFNSKSQDLLKDISLFSIKRIMEVKKSATSLPIDAFNAFYSVYNMFIELEELKKEYIQFSGYFDEISKSIKLPEQLNANNSENIELSDSDDDSTDEKSYNNQITAHNLGSLHNLFKIFHMSGLKEVFPNLYSSLHIAATLPVTSASPERTFSKLKLVKTRLRSTMAQTRLENLMLISCENIWTIQK